MSANESPVIPQFFAYRLVSDRLYRRTNDPIVRVATKYRRSNDFGIVAVATKYRRSSDLGAIERRGAEGFPRC